MILSDLIATLEQIAPTKRAEPWDNVGLLVGDPGQEIHKALLAIDYTPAVAEERRRFGCDVVITYHPPIFDALKRVTSDGPASLVFDAIREGIAIYSPHTAWDVADGGANDMLADVLGLSERAPLRLAETRPAELKLVTFVPPESADRVADALFEAGAGRIGDYSHCSFRQPGTGTFFGQAGARPSMGRSGRLERIEEIRIETLLPIARVAAALIALRQAHPYEEPAFDLVQLAAPPEQTGQGRIGVMPPAERTEVFARIKSGLGLDRILVAGPPTGRITRAACCAGSCGDLLDDAMRQGAELLLTGELRHHSALKAANAGMTVVCTLHTNSERASLDRLAKRLTHLMPQLPITLSHADRDPFNFM